MWISTCDSNMGQYRVACTNNVPSSCVSKVAADWTLYNITESVDDLQLYKLVSCCIGLNILTSR